MSESERRYTKVASTSLVMPAAAERFDEGSYDQYSSPDCASSEADGGRICHVLNFELFFRSFAKRRCVPLMAQAVLGHTHTPLPPSARTETQLVL